jgi:transposase
MYGSDLSDIEWEIIRPYVEKRHKIGRPDKVDRRKIIDAIFYQSRSGCQWRMLPKD